MNDLKISFKQSKMNSFKGLIEKNYSKSSRRLSIHIDDFISLENKNKMIEFYPFTYTSTINTTYKSLY